VASADGPTDHDLEAGSDGKSVVKGATQRHVALTLSLHMNERGGSCYPGIARIAAESGLSSRAVQKGLRALERTGWIAVETARAPDGTNLYTATIPTTYEHDEGGGAPGAGAHPVPEGGAPGAPKGVNEGGNVSPTERLVADAWRANAPPLIEHRDSYLSAARTRTAIRAAVRVYPAEDVAAAVANYAAVLVGDEYRWSHRWPLVEFLKRGLDRFVPEADPLRNFRTRSTPVAASGDGAEFADLPEL
jgi:hypothetical protein